MKDDKAKPVSKGGRPAYQPNEKDRAMVEAMAGYGVIQDDIATVLGIHDDTLRKYYARELATAKILSLAKVKQSMFWMATKGRNVTAGIFILKTQAGWREQQEVAITGPEGGPVTFRWADASPASADGGAVVAGAVAGLVTADDDDA